MQRNIMITADGSHSLFVPAINEHYHSFHGAIQESLHVFIQTGLEAIDSGLRKVNILEAGFGTGLNALLTYLHVMTGGREIFYTSLEAFPLVEEEYLQLNYPVLLEGEDNASVFQALHRAGWGEMTEISPFFHLCKINEKIEFFESETHFDLVYFDAFAPEKQPELWTTEIFQKIFRMMNPGALLTTYCARGAVKRALREAGFKVEAIPGPPGKREITRARKP